MIEVNKEELEVNPGEIWECCGVSVRALRQIVYEKEYGYGFPLETWYLLRVVKGGYIYGQWLAEVVNVNISEGHPFFGRNIPWHEIGCISACHLGRMGSAWRKVS
jgi:hypothetical protein